MKAPFWSTSKKLLPTHNVNVKRREKVGNRRQSLAEVAKIEHRNVMNKFISGVKNLSQKAAELKATMQQLPPKVAEVREAVAATTGQLQQLKSEIQFSVADLKADDENRLTTALQEINASADVFAKAGFVLSGVDLEISPVQRMLIHLARLEDVHPSVMRSLLSANKQRRTTCAILSALLQAQQMAASVELGELTYAEVAVGVGPVPSVRLCWRADESKEWPDPAVSGQSIPVPPPVTAPAPSAFSQTSYFEKRPAQPAPVTAQSHAAAPVTAISTPLPVLPDRPSVIETEVSTGGQKEDPLARFKRMPDLSKLKR